MREASGTRVGRHVYYHGSGLHHTPSVTNPGRPRAATMMSASRHISFMLRVEEWQTVTVQSPGCAFCISSVAMGLPTMLLRPTDHRVFTFGLDSVAFVSP